jgi:5-methylcytosine-specific restriction endonuclease McrA
VLLLNGSREPLSFISEESAIVLVLKGRVEILSEWADAPIRSAHASWSVPAVIALKRYITKRWHAPRFRRRALFNRDGWTCQYCGDAVLPRTAEVEHVLPASRGGRTTWKNCVTACRKCNKRKRDKTPAEAEMPLLAEPREPHPLHFLDAASRSVWHDSWNDYTGRPT